MTVLGKILVFVNLVFSLVTGALIIMVFVTRSHWEAGYNDLMKKYMAQQATIKTYQGDAQTWANEKQQRDEQIKALAQSAKTSDENLTKEKADRTALSQKLETRIKEVEAALEANTAEKLRRQQEVEFLKGVNEAKEKKLAEMEGDVKKLRDRTVNAEIQYKAALERNALLLDQVEKLDRDNQQIRASQVVGGTGRGTAVVAGKQPPPEDLKGSVLEVDVKSGLLTISLGSDSGLKVGNTLEVYRLEPKPEYLGTIRIVDTHFKYAVARPVAPLQASTLAKDPNQVKNIIVASRISGR